MWIVYVMHKNNRRKVMRVAIVHHWFVTRGGGERVAECIASMFPNAEIFTLVANERIIPESLRSRRWHTSFLQHVPLASRFHRHMMPLYAAATESLDLRGFDLVISSDSGPVKGVRVDPGAIHICYCHSPMRYLYDGYDEYRAHMGSVTGGIFSAMSATLRSWDIQAAQRVTHFIANSRYVADRIRRWYNRDSTVINPPIEVARGQIGKPRDHFLCAGRLVFYKRTDLLIQACMKLGRKLVVAGTGPEETTLKQMANSNVTFLGELSTSALWEQFSLCRALLFAADEDFGMIPLEVQACGRPVIAYGHGGSLETVRADGEDATGVFFYEQNVDSVAEGILRFEAREGKFDPDRTRTHAQAFDEKVFKSKLRAFIVDRVPNVEKEIRN
jgi:glycosyltransferase involved in cell wall biosynthesis